MDSIIPDTRGISLIRQAEMGYYLTIGPRQGLGIEGIHDEWNIPDWYLEWSKAVVARHSLPKRRTKYEY